MFFLGKTDMFKTSSELVYFGAHTPFAVSGLGSAFISVLHPHTSLWMHETEQYEGCFSLTVYYMLLA